MTAEPRAPLQRGRPRKSTLPARAAERTATSARVLRHTHIVLIYICHIDLFIFTYLIYHQNARVTAEALSTMQPIVPLTPMHMDPLQFQPTVPLQFQPMQFMMPMLQSPSMSTAAYMMPLSQSHNNSTLPLYTDQVSLARSLGPHGLL